jgi:sugar O-acyltransferase (sialic acid O-acetyltransferase NeuD family)
MSRPLIILGTGGNALDFLDVVEAINRAAPTWELVGFLDDGRPAGSSFHGVEVLGPVARASEFRRSWFVNAIGSDKSYRRRPEIVEATGLGDDYFATLIHPGACVSARANVGPGAVINFGASVGGEVQVGRHATLGPGCVIGHNVVVEDHAVVAPGAIVSGFVRLGRGCYIGARAVVKQKVTVGASALVGLGAVVVKDVPAETTVVGNPARAMVRAESVAFAGAR